MPDIFMTRIDWSGKPYYEIYMQKIVDEKQKYCLKVTNQHFQAPKQQISTSDSNIPLIEFYDINRDGMPDMLYFHRGSLIVHYNKLRPKLPLAYALAYEQNLCYSQDELSEDAPCADYEGSQELDKGNYYITSQDLSETFPNHLVMGLANPLLEGSGN